MRRDDGGVTGERAKITSLPPSTSTASVDPFRAALAAATATQIIIPSNSHHNQPAMATKVQSVSVSDEHVGKFFSFIVISHHHIGDEQMLNRHDSWDCGQCSIG
jgi:hypothetical protein